MLLPLGDGIRVIDGMLNNICQRNPGLVSFSQDGGLTQGVVVTNDMVVDDEDVLESLHPKLLQMCSRSTSCERIVTLP